MSLSVLRAAVDMVRRSVFVAVLAAPVMAVGCASEADENVSEEGAAISGRDFEAGEILRVTANELNVRARAGTQYRAIAAVQRGELVTVVETSGRNGWVFIRTPEGTEGWAARSYLIEADEADEATGDEPDVAPRDGESCSPSRGQDIVNRYQKALHDTIAYAEGTRDHSKDGYDTLFGFGTYSSCMRHPNRCIRYGSTCSTAAGRYQFLHGTWRSIANVRGYATFEPENQERGAEYLVKSVRRASIPADRALTYDEFVVVMQKLSYEWASLPPGRYGQPKKSYSELRRVYCDVVECPSS